MREPGLPSGGLQLATAAVSNYACNQAGTCYVAAHSYPTNIGTAVPNYMYGILPGYANGVQGGGTIPNASAARNDSMTVRLRGLQFLAQELHLCATQRDSGPSHSENYA